MPSIDGLQHCLKGRLPLNLYLPIKCLAKYWHSGTVEVQDTSRHYRLGCSKHRWLKSSLVVDTVGEVVTTGLYICEFLMKR